MAKKQAKVYGTAKRKETREHDISSHIRAVWKRRKDGVKQRYHKRIKAYKQKRTRTVKKYIEKYTKEGIGKEVLAEVKELIKEEEWVDFKVTSP